MSTSTSIVPTVRKRRAQPRVEVIEPERPTPRTEIPRGTQMYMTALFGTLKDSGIRSGLSERDREEYQLRVQLIREEFEAQMRDFFEWTLKAWDRNATVRQRQEAATAAFRRKWRRLTDPMEDAITQEQG